MSTASNEKDGNGSDITPEESVVSGDDGGNANLSTNLESSKDQKGKGLLINKVLQKLQDSVNSGEASPDDSDGDVASVPQDNGANGNNRGGSSRRKPKKTMRIVENDNNKEQVNAEGDDESMERRPNNGNSEKRSKSPDGRGDAFDVDADGNYILPEGTVVVQPEAVDDKPEFKGPEFKRGAGSSATRETRRQGIRPDQMLQVPDPNNPLDILHCTACNKRINHTVAGNAVRHPALKVIVCKKCYRWYTSAEIEQDKNGVDEQCRWCGEGGNLICCDKCHNAFCKGCIKRNLGRTELNAIVQADETSTWKCYICDPTPLGNLREFCDKVLAAIAKKMQARSARRAERVINIAPTPPKVVTPAKTFTGAQLLAAARRNVNVVAPVSAPQPGPGAAVPVGDVYRVAQAGEMCITEENVVTVLDRMMAATQSLTVLLSAMKDDLVKDLPSLANGGMPSTAAIARAQHTRVEVASRLRRAMINFKKNLTDIEIHARQYRSVVDMKKNAMLGGKNDQRSTVKTVGSTHLLTIKTPQGDHQTLKLHEPPSIESGRPNKIPAVNSTPPPPQKRVARKSTTPRTMPRRAREEVVVLDSSDDDPNTSKDEQSSPPSKRSKVVVKQEDDDSKSTKSDGGKSQESTAVDNESMDDIDNNVKDEGILVKDELSNDSKENETLKNLQLAPSNKSEDITDHAENSKTEISRSILPKNTDESNNEAAHSTNEEDEAASDHELSLAMQCDGSSQQKSKSERTTGKIEKNFGSSRDDMEAQRQMHKEMLETDEDEEGSTTSSSDSSTRRRSSRRTRQKTKVLKEKSSVSGKNKSKKPTPTAVKKALLMKEIKPKYRRELESLLVHSDSAADFENLVPNHHSKNKKHVSRIGSNDTEPKRKLHLDRKKKKVPTATLR